MIEAFLMSTGIVALAEMGDKTQLLALVLAARFRKPVPIILGILVATLLNHGVAGALGSWLMHWVGPQVMRWILGVSFLAMAGWILIPDKLDDFRFCVSHFHSFVFLKINLASLLFFSGLGIFYCNF